MVKGGGIEQPWLAEKPLQIESINGELKSSIGITAPHIQIECSSACQTRIKVSYEMMDSGSKYGFILL